MKEVINSVKIKDRAMELSAKMKKEDGVAETIKALEEFYRISMVS